MQQRFDTLSVQEKQELSLMIFEKIKLLYLNFLMEME